jgi:hypothetical protein
VSVACPMARSGTACSGHSWTQQIGSELEVLWSRKHDKPVPKLTAPHALLSLIVAISDRTRKILWAKAGGRCSICRELVVTEGTDTDDPSVFGQEAHIIAEAPNGPRHADLPEYDVYYNLILLCSKHHKQVDDQVEHYTTGRLKEIKQEHENWVASLGGRPTRLVPDPAHPMSKTLTVCMTGNTLWNIAQGSMSMSPSWPDGLSEEQQDLIAALLDELSDWIDVASMENNYRAGRDAAKALGEYIKDLHTANLLVGARRRYLLLTDGWQEPSRWRSLDIEIQPLGMAQVIDEKGAQIWPPLENEENTASS